MKRLLSIAALMITVACGEPFLHLNPYDPAFPLAVDVTGPDTLFSLGEIGSYSVRFTPAVFADSAITWLSDTVTIFQRTHPTFPKVLLICKPVRMEIFSRSIRRSNQPS